MSTAYDYVPKNIESTLHTPHKFTHNDDMPMTQTAGIKYDISVPLTNANVYAPKDDEVALATSHKFTNDDDIPTA